MFTTNSELTLKGMKRELEDEIISDKDIERYFSEGGTTHRTNIIMKSNLVIINYLLTQANDKSKG